MFVNWTVIIDSITDVETDCAHLNNWNSEEYYCENIAYCKVYNRGLMLTISKTFIIIFTYNSFTQTLKELSIKINPYIVLVSVWPLFSFYFKGFTWNL